MARQDEIKSFYMEHLPGAKEDGNLIKAPCPLCSSQGGDKPGLRRMRKQFRFGHKGERSWRGQGQQGDIFPALVFW